MLRSIHSLALPRAVPERRAASVDAWLAYRAADAASTSPESVALRWLYNDMLQGFAPADRATEHSRWRCIVAQVQSLLIHPIGDNHTNIPLGVGNATLLPDATGANAPPSGRLPGTERVHLASPNGPFGAWRPNNTPEEIPLQWAAEGGLLAAYFGQATGGQFDFSGRLVRLGAGRYRVRDYASLRSVLCTSQHAMVMSICRAAGHLCTIGATDNHDPMVVWVAEWNKWAYTCATFCEELRHPLLASSLSNAELLHLSVGGGWGPVTTERHPVQTWEAGGLWMVETPVGGAAHQANTYRWAHPQGTSMAGAQWGVLDAGYRMIDSQGLRTGYLAGNETFPAWPESEVYPHLGLGVEGERYDAAQGSWTWRTVPPVRHPGAVMEVRVGADWRPSSGSHVAGPGQSVTVRALDASSGDLLAMDTFTV